MKNFLCWAACAWSIVGCSSTDEGLSPASDVDSATSDDTSTSNDTSTVDDGTVSETASEVATETAAETSSDAISEAAMTDTATDGACALPKLKLTPIVTTGLTLPLQVTAPLGDATRLFIVEKGGAIKLVKSGVLLPTPFLTVSDVYIPSATAEGGLLGLTFHPSYSTNGRFFIHYTHTPSGNVVVREMRRSAANPDLADTTPVKTFIDTPHGGWNHCGGGLAFGPDGKLFASIGDTAVMPSPTRDLSKPLGKILRFDVDAHPTAPAGNMTGAGVNPYVWDYGLRNPWRFSFDRTTGDLYIGDVGQSTWEEIDFEPSGAGKRDYGWDVMEGAHCFTAGCTTTGILPIDEHNHDSGEGGSITGGYVYRGDAIPCLRGRYIYTDYVTNRFFSFVQAGGVATQKLELTTDLMTPDLVTAGVTRIASFGEDAAGELYVVNLTPGRVYRIDKE